MKLLLITSSYPNKNEGSAAAGLFVRDFAEALSEQSIEVEIVAPAKVSAQTRNRRLTVTTFAVPRLPLSLLHPINPLDWVPILKTLLVGKRTVLQSCKDNKPDHIFALWALPSGYWAHQVMQQFSIPYSVWALGSDIWGLGRFPLIRNRLGIVLQDASHCFADGIKLASDVQHISNRECRFLPSSRVFGPPGIRCSRNSPPYRLAFLGRWHHNKGPDLLLDALAMLTGAEWSKLEAVRVCGGGPLESVIHRRVKTLVAAGRPVELRGYLDQAAARELFEWADYIVIPSRIESIPVVFSDAMQMQRPVIAMPVGDLKDLIYRFKCGVVANEVSALGFSEALRKAIETSPSCFQVGLAAAAGIFHVQATATEFLRAIRH